MATCWKCHPDTWCVRSTGDLCDEHREPERERLRALKAKYTHLSLDEQNALWRHEQRLKRARPTAGGGAEVQRE